MTLLIAVTAASARGEVSRGLDHAVIDGVKITFGDVIEVSGPCREIDPFRKLGTGAACLSGIRINGVANQDELDVHLFSSDRKDLPSFERLRGLKPETWYKVRGLLTDARVFGPHRAIGVVVKEIESTPSAPRSFSDFARRTATFEGTAANVGVLMTQGGSAQVTGLKGWPKAAQGKQIAVRGIVERDAGGWRIDRPDWKLVRLEDQVDREVSLDGYLLNLGFDWWFVYRGEKLYLTTARGPAMKFPNGDHGRRARISGKLVRQLRTPPPPEGVKEETDVDFAPCFVIRAANVEYLESESSFAQKFGGIYDTYHTIRDGVPEILAWGTYQKNPIPYDTDARHFAGRNLEAIDAILSDPSRERLEIVARRMEDGSLPMAVRLLYAATLARANDERGRSFLIGTIDENRNESMADALYCLGVFASLAPKQTDLKVDAAWAEKPLIGLMTNWKPAGVTIGTYSPAPPDGTLSIADAVALYSGIPHMLLRFNSAPARKALVDYVRARGTFADRVIHAFCTPGTTVPVDDLMQIEPVIKDKSKRHRLLQQVLRQKQPFAVEPFLKDLGDGFAYMAFRDDGTPAVLASIRSNMDRLEGKARDNARMLVILADKESIQTLVGLLDNPEWKDKNFVLYELARLKDSRAVDAVARTLGKAPPDYFNNDRNAYIAVEHGLEAIAHVGTKTALLALAELLPVDLARFGAPTDRARLQRMIATHLIEATGESFGTDADAWRKWLQSQPASRFDP